MNDSIKASLEALGLTLPSTGGESYYGAAYGTPTPQRRHRTGARRRHSRSATSVQVGSTNTS